MTDLSKLADKLDALIKSATPRPWTVEDPMGPDSLWVVPAGKPTHEWFPIAVVNMPDEEDHLFTGREAKANVRITALAPLLAAVAREVPDLIDMAASYLNICPDRHGHSVETLNRARASLAALAKEIDNG